MPTQFSPVALFCFGLTVLVVGYILVEILRGEKYPLRKIMERNKRNLFDRVVHYIGRGIIINFVIVMLFSLSGNLGIFARLLDSAGGIANILGKGTKNIVNIQMIIFSIYYFIAVTMATLIGFHLVKYLWKCLDKIFKKKKKRKKKSKK